MKRLLWPLGFTIGFVQGFKQAFTDSFKRSYNKQRRDRLTKRQLELILGYSQKRAGH